MDFGGGKEARPSHDGMNGKEKGALKTLSTERRAV
jgi:hypothetical protein